MTLTPAEQTSIASRVQWITRTLRKLRAHKGDRLFKATVIALLDEIAKIQAEPLTANGEKDLPSSEHAPDKTPTTRTPRAPHAEA